ncbi:uncharacterized protein V6R79_006285 [Siganus canaliculatus]
MADNSSFADMYSVMHKCFNSTVGVVNITAFTVSSIVLILPLCIFIVYLGVQRWRQRRPGQTMSHSDVFTYHMVVMEITNISGAIAACCAVFTGAFHMVMVSMDILIVSSTGQTYFHLLTCVDRYLAVVHPVTYLRLRTEKGARIRNIAAGCVWFLCSGNIWFKFVISLEFVSPFIYFFMVATLIILCFCSLSILCVLIRPAPGDGGGARQRVDQSKLRAFHTIMAILGMLLVRFGGNLVNAVEFASPVADETRLCVFALSTFWFYLPSSLILPLLYLQRAGKLACGKNK